MSEPRGEQAYAALPGGKVLIAGGYTYSPKPRPLKTAELFNPETNNFEKLSAEMITERVGPAAAVLPNGKVLIVGGEAAPGKPLKSAELFNPATNTFEKLPGEAGVGRYFPAAITLPNGKVLIAGGMGEGSGGLNSAELFNPETDTFEALTGTTHEMTEARSEPAATLLKSGRALILGGDNKASEVLKTVEAFNFETNTFEKLTSELTEPRQGLAAATLLDGGMLIAGGYNVIVEPRYLKTAEQTPPVATTSAASSVNVNTATLNGTVVGETPSTAYFQYGTSTAYGSVTPHQTVAASLTPLSVPAAISGLAPATTYHFRVVDEQAGGPSYGADQTFTTHEPAPILSGASESHRIWREGSKLAQITKKGKPPVGTTFSFTLNEPASVTFTFAQRVSGPRVKGKCVAQTRKDRHKPSCKRTITRGAFTFTGHAGTNRVVFKGRVSRSNRLPLGAYTLTITATDTAGQRSSSAQLRFKIVK